MGRCNSFGAIGVVMSLDGSGFAFNPLLQSLLTVNSEDNPMREFESILIEDGGSNELESFGVGPVDAAFVVSSESTKFDIL